MTALGVIYSPTWPFCVPETMTNNNKDNHLQEFLEHLKWEKHPIWRPLNTYGLIGIGLVTGSVLGYCVSLI